MSQTIDLSGFTGSATWFRHPMFPSFLYTEGVQYLAEKAGAYWLIDACLSHQLNPTVRAQEFQVWTLTKHPDDTASLVLTDGNDREVTRQEIGFTDFPMETITLWLANKTLYLPSEH